MKTSPELARLTFRYVGGFAALFLLWSAKLSAQKSVVEEKPVFEVIYQDSPGDYLVFKVQFTYTGIKKPVLKVLDDNSALLYSELISMESYSKIFKIPKNDVKGQLQFRIYSGKEILKKTFEIKKVAKEYVEITEKEI